MYKHKILAVISFSLLASSAFAGSLPLPDDAVSPAPMPTPTKTPRSKVLAFDYSCFFKEKHDQDIKSGDDHKLKCWVSGFFCAEKEMEAIGLTVKESCDYLNNPISIACNNGFKLSEDSAAVVIEDKTLWINAEREDEKSVPGLLSGRSKDPIATLRVQDFLSRDLYNPTFFKKADLVISEENGDADRLEGQCEFHKVDVLSKKPIKP